MYRFSKIFPGESQILTFDLAANLPSGTTLTGTPTVVAVQCLEGDDPDPSAIIAGPLSLDSTQTQILVPVKCSLQNARYVILVNCASTTAYLAPSMAAELPVGFPAPTD